MKSIRVPSMKVICPTAPRAPVSLNAGFEMPSWFDLKTLDISAPEDEVGIRKATDNVHAMIISEINVRIILSDYISNSVLKFLGRYSSKSYNYWWIQSRRSSSIIFSSNI